MALLKDPRNLDLSNVPFWEGSNEYIEIRAIMVRSMPENGLGAHITAARFPHEPAGIQIDMSPAFEAWLHTDPWIHSFAP